MTTRPTRKKQKRFIYLKVEESQALCLWAAIVLREPEPLTRLLKKLLKPAAKIIPGYRAAQRRARK